MIHQVVPHLRLLTLGAPLLLSTTNEAVRYRTRKHFALLIRLALEPGRKFTRDYLIDLLWPDVPAERGRHSLSQAITVLRQTVGRENLAAPRATVCLAEGVVAVDALRFESGEEEIRGRFLEGFELRGARGFDEWREGWEARLHPRIRDCLVKRMDAARRIGDFATVERHARVLEEIDPLSEDAVRGIMEARAWVGDRSNALKAFNRFAKRLAEELEAKPSLELQRIADLLREGRRAAPRPMADGAPPGEERRFEAETIIGRQQEFSALYDAWIQVRSNTPRLIVLLGDPGIGKTTLTNAFASSCQMEGGIIARTQAYDGERELPYAVLAELVRQLTLQRAIGAAESEALAELSRLTPEVADYYRGIPQPAEWPPEVVPLRFADAFHKAVTAASVDFPVVLIVDDIHAADNASVAILHMLARKLAGLRVLLIVTGRPGSLRPPSSAHALVTDTAVDGLGTIELDALSNESAALLVARASVKGIERWGDPPVEHIVRAGGGNPLALELLSREWVASGGDSLVGKLDPLHPLPAGLQSIPKAIRTMVERQTEALSERTRAVFDLASVLGRRMGDLWLYQVIGCSEAEALHELSKLLEVRLLREVAGSLEFRNELIRAHAYYVVPSTVRLELHRRIAGMLETREGGGEPNDLEIAWHFILGRDLSRAISHALAGAERSLRAGAAREAELILRHLMAEHVGRDSARRIQLLLGSALMSQSKAQEALPHLEAQLVDTGASRSEVAQAAWMCAKAIYLVNKDTGSKHTEMAERAVQVARESQDKELLSRALLERARAGVESGSEQTIWTARKELRDSVLAPADPPPPMAHYADSFCSYHLLDIGAALDAAERAVEGLLKEGSIWEAELAYTALGNCNAALCRFECARSAYARALQLSKKMGDDCRISIVSSNMGASYLMSGDIEKAMVFGEESLRVGKIAPTQPTLVNTISNLAFSYVLRGHANRVGECVQLLRSWIQDRRSWTLTMECRVAIAEIELALGNTSEALSMVAETLHETHQQSRIFAGQGTFERLTVLLAYHTDGPEAATLLSQGFLARYRHRHMLAHLEVVAAVAWAERMSRGTYSEETRRELGLFDTHGALGKRAVIAAQGFLD